MHITLTHTHTHNVKRQSANNLIKQGYNLGGSACLACLRPWTESLKQQEREKRKKKGGGEKERAQSGHLKKGHQE